MILHYNLLIPMQTIQGWFSEISHSIIQRQRLLEIEHHIVWSRLPVTYFCCTRMFFFPSLPRFLDPFQLSAKLFQHFLCNLFFVHNMGIICIFNIIRNSHSNQSKTSKIGSYATELFHNIFLTSPQIFSFYAKFIISSSTFHKCSSFNPVTQA